jgi:phosphoglycolate phosphatase-like HAD superfamily hydrolase
VGRRLLFLDFDGVICDSIDECFVSSWIAHFQGLGQSLPGSLPVEMRRRFARLRPFIRSGEDYVVIQELVAGGLEVADQRAFDAALAARGPQGMARAKETFYAARSGLLASDRAYWLSLNRVYPHVQAPLAAVAARDDVLVLSTKKSEFIVEILAASGIRFPIERVIYTGSRTKAEIVVGMLADSDGAVLVDDQIDHLVGCTDPRIQVHLALWGYIRTEWLAQHPAVPRLDATDFGALVEPWLTRPRRAGA